MIRHIRKYGGDIDRRMRWSRKRKTTAGRAPETLCGAPVTTEDFSKDNAQHSIKWEYLKPEWSADICADCRKLLPDAKS